MSAAALPPIYPPHVAPAIALLAIAVAVAIVGLLLPK